MVAAQTPWWTWTWPALAWAILLIATFISSGDLVTALAGIVLIATVFSAVHHAEVIAHRVGEPFGTLVLALAVTVIETALIVSIMLSAPAEKAGLARDTVFAAVMIVCNGIVGLCLLLGGAQHREQGFHPPVWWPASCRRYRSGWHYACQSRCHRSPIAVGRLAYGGAHIGP